MKFEKLKNEDIWWDIIHNCNYATFFHTPIWTKLALRTFPDYKDATIFKKLGNKVRIIFPIVEVNSIGGNFRDQTSTFAGCYGDIIADGPVNHTEKVNIYDEILSSKTGRLRIIGNPFAESINHIKGYQKNINSTHILELTSDFKSVFTNFSKGHRSSYKRGQRMGVTIRLADCIEDYKAYFMAYEDSLKRWGNKATSIYPWNLFETCFYLSQVYSQNIKLWIAEIDRKLIGGALVFYWGQYVVWWHGAAYADYFEYYPNNVLQTNILKDAVQNGYRFYDFNPSGGHIGVEKFKSRFGAVQTPVFQFKYESRSFAISRMIKNFLIP